MNRDQAGVHIVPSQNRTMEKRGSHVEVAGNNDKLMTWTLAGTLSGELPLQLLYQGKTEHSHPKLTFPLMTLILGTPHNMGQMKRQSFDSSSLYLFLCTKCSCCDQ